MKTKIISEDQALHLRIGDRVEKYPEHEGALPDFFALPGHSVEYYEVGAIHASSHTLGLTMTAATMPLLPMPGEVARQFISPATMAAAACWWISDNGTP